MQNRIINATEASTQPEGPRIIKLVLADMDGTLLPFGARVISEHTHQAILAAIDAGIAFGPASGRDYINLVEPFEADAQITTVGIYVNIDHVPLERLREQCLEACPELDFSPPATSCPTPPTTPWPSSSSTS